MKSAFEMEIASVQEREIAMLRNRLSDLIDACEEAYRRIGDRPHDAQWVHDKPLMDKLADALRLKTWERY